MGKQPDADQNYRMRRVLIYTKEERCSCTKVILGGMNMDIITPPSGAEDLFYTDEPLLFVNNHDVNNLRELLGCPVMNGRLDNNGMEHTLKNPIRPSL